MCSIVKPKDHVTKKYISLTRVVKNIAPVSQREPPKSILETIYSMLNLGVFVRTVKMFY